MPQACPGFLPDLIHPHVQTHPGSQAIAAWDGEMTYGQLHSLSARLGQFLRKLGIKSGVLVALCFEKSAWAVVSMLGVFLAGGACVPLDPCHPASRRESILNDIEAQTVICSPQHKTHFQDSGRYVLVLDAAFMESLPTEIPATFGGAPSDAAYVIFTSGSTGQPKGIIVEHAAFCTSIKTSRPGDEI